MADTPYVPGMAPELVESSNAAKAEALRRTLRAGLLGLGGGTALAAILSLPHALSKKHIPSYPLQTEVDLAYPQEVKKAAGGNLTNAILTPPTAAAVEAYFGHKKDKTREGTLRAGLTGALAGTASVPGMLLGSGIGRVLSKKYPALRFRTPEIAINKMPLNKRQLLLPLLLGSAGGAGSYAAARPTAEKIVDATIDKNADWADSVASNTMSAKPGEPVPTTLSPAWARGDTQTSPKSIPWAAPAAVGAAGLGSYGGYQLVRYVLRKRRKAELDSELQNAQQEYEEAMLSQYDPSKLRDLSPKEASATTALDFCFEKLEKAGFDVNSLLGQAAGLYGVGALGLGTAAGVGTYKYFRSRSGEKLLRDALKRRAQLRNLQNPPDMFVRPVPVEYVEPTKEK